MESVIGDNWSLALAMSGALAGHMQFDDQAALQPWPIVLQHLERLAMVTRRAHPNGPQPTVRCIDVSTVVPRKKKPRG